MEARYPFKRFAAWLIDLVLIGFVSMLALGPALIAVTPMDSFLISVASAIIGFAYFAIFLVTSSTTPGLMVMRGSLQGPRLKRALSAGILASTLLPFGFVLLVLEPRFDVLGSFGVEVRV